MERVVVNVLSGTKGSARWSRFEPEGISGDKFLGLLWERQEDKAEEKLTDAVFGAERLPVNPHPASWLNAFAVKCPVFQMDAEGMAPANLKVADAEFVYRLWFFLPVEVTESEKSSAENLFHMVRHCYGSLLSGVVLDEFPNPYVDQGVAFEWQPERTNLAHMRKSLILAKNWTDTLPPEFASRGGSADTESQRIARRANLTAINERRRAEADQHAAQLLAAVTKGRTLAEIAKTLQISEDSVSRAVVRAKARLGKS